MLDSTFYAMRLSGVRCIIFLLLPWVVTSCLKPGNYNIRERYVVNTKTLIARSSPSTASTPVFTFQQGDTLAAMASDTEWVMVKVGSKKGFVAATYLQRIEPTPTPKLLSWVEKTASWESWIFWVTAISAIVIWIISGKKIIQIKNRLAKKHDFQVKGLVLMPVVFFINALLLSILYINWKDLIISSIYHGIRAIPNNPDIMDWVVWCQALSLLASFLVDLFGTVIKSGILWGVVLTFVDLLWSVFIFAATFFLTLSLYYYAIVFLLIFFGIQYVSMVYQNSRKISSYSRPR